MRIDANLVDPLLEWVGTFAETAERMTARG